MSSWPEIVEKFSGAWVALTDDDEVIVSAPSAEQAYRTATDLGYSNPIIFQVPETSIDFVGYKISV